METRIENAPVLLKGDYANHNMLCAFNSILEVSTSSKNLEELKTKIRTDVSYLFITYFDYGFGSSHMWVSQKEVLGNDAKINENKRLLIITE